MKRILFMLAFVLPLVGFVSCGNDDDEPEIEEVDEVVGTWKVTDFSMDGSVYAKWAFETTTATFRADGTYTGAGYFGYGSGTWKRKGNTIITYVDGSEYLSYEIQWVEGNKCELLMSMKGSTKTVWLVCVKSSSSEMSELITKEELERVTSFVCDEDSYTKLYIKFRGGHIYTQNVTNDGEKYNQDDIIYTLSGSKITITMGRQHSTGTIFKKSYPNGSVGIIMEFEGTYGIATWLSKTFKSSYVNF